MASHFAIGNQDYKTMSDAKTTSNDGPGTPGSETVLKVHFGDAVSALELAAFDQIAKARSMTRAELLAEYVRTVVSGEQTAA